MGQAAAQLAVGATAAAVAAGVNHAANASPEDPGDRAANDLQRERRIREQKEREEAETKLRALKQAEETRAADFPSL